MTIEKNIYFSIRDDDTCYFTSPEKLRNNYGDIWDYCPINLSVVPFQACTKSGALPKEKWHGYEIYPIGDNVELTEFLRKLVKEKKVYLTLHGYSHKDEIEGWEFHSGSELDSKIKIGKKYLSDLFGQEISVFVPPHNSISSKALTYVIESGLDISGVQSFRPSYRGFNWQVLCLGLKRKIKLILNKDSIDIPILFPDNHIELPYIPLTPLVKLSTLIQKFDMIVKKGGFFCIATHYWELDHKCKDGKTLKQALDIILEKVLSLKDRVILCNFKEVCDIYRKGHESNIY